MSHFTHHTAAVPLLKGGLYVLVEKPVGFTVRAGQQFIKTAEKNGRILATANIRGGGSGRASADGR